MLMVGVYLLRIQILVVGGYPAPTQWVCRLGLVRRRGQCDPRGNPGLLGFQAHHSVVCVGMRGRRGDGNAASCIRWSCSRASNFSPRSIREEIRACTGNAAQNIHMGGSFTVAMEDLKFDSSPFYAASPILYWNSDPDGLTLLPPDSSSSRSSRHPWRCSAAY
jgi:hypothetical protein